MGKSVLPATQQSVRNAGGPAKKSRPSQIILTIEYTADIDRLNVEEILDRLRETGAAEIVNAEMKKEN